MARICGGFRFAKYFKRQFLTVLSSANNGSIKNISVHPSMLSANPAKFEQELFDVESAGADCIHWDVMDGSFVDAITFGAHIIESLRKVSRLRFDAHLMIENPEKHISRFARAGSDTIIVHPETCKHLRNTLLQIKKENKRSGIALDPEIGIDCVERCSDIVDMVVVMGVNPGKSGQQFIKSQLMNIQKVKSIIPNYVELCVDGGINDRTINDCIDHGATSFVTGSFLFQSGNYKKIIELLKTHR
jgi:ribulose-phosphate 3-epimerase